MKKIIAFAMALILAVGCLSMSAAAFEEDYTLQFGDDGKLLYKI